MWCRTVTRLKSRPLQISRILTTHPTSTWHRSFATDTPPKTEAPSHVIVPEEADIVIVGGGVIGTSIAYHLAKAGAKNVVLLEKSQLTHGCTWHAAGLLGQLRTNKNLTRMLQYSAQCFSQLEEDTGINPDWAPVGSLRLACTLDRWKELKRSNSQAVSFGFDMRLVSPQEAKELCPILNVDDVIGAAYIPSDGHMDPSSLTNAFATGARQRGVQILQGIEVTRVTRRHNRIVELHTRDKEGIEKSIRVQRVVNAGGIWARELGKIMGISVPTVNVEHQYMVSEKIVGMPAKLPSIRDPDHKIYYKTEVRGLAIGGWEHDTLAVRIPSSFGPELYTSNFDRFGPLAEAAGHRTPCVNEFGIKTLINGPIPVSPDGEPIMGKAPELENVFVAAGFTAGIGASGGAGKYMAEWILNGEPSIDLWPLDIRRFGPVHNTRSFLELRTVEAYGNYYRINPPGVEMQSARPMRTSPIYDETKSQGAVMGSKFGWERPLWFSTPDKGNKDPREKPSYNRPAWFDAVGEEHRAVRERVGIIDQSSFAKLEVSGPRALECIQHVIVNDASGPPGTVVYTQMCNERGGIEADITVVRLEEEKFYVITGSGFGVRDFTWIRDHLPPSARNLDGTLSGVTLTDVTTQYAVINVCGPRSRDVLQAAGVEGLSNQECPFMTYRNVEIGLAPVRAVRVTFVGELGWELHIPVEYARAVYFLLCSVGQSFGITPVGYRAIESLRLEKGYRVWGSDITPGYNPYEAGLGFCVKLKKSNDFVGKEALSIFQKTGVERKFVTFLIDEQALNDDNMGFTGPDVVANRPLLLSGNEAILLDGKVVGVTTSAGYGYTVGRTIIFAYVPASSIERNDFQLHAYGKTIPIQLQRPLNASLYDNKRENILK